MNKITQIVFPVMAILVAIVLGASLPTAQIEVLAFVFGGAIFGVCLAMGGRIWMLLPMFLLCEGLVRFLPGALEPRFFCIIIAAGFMLLRFLGGVREIRYRLTTIDILVLLHLPLFLLAYIRNPVGVNLFGSGIIGGKPYLFFGLSILGYFILGSIKINIQGFKKIVVTMFTIGVLERIYTTLCGMFPSIGIYAESYYGLGVSRGTFGGVQSLADTRFVYMKSLGILLAGIVFCYWRPITTMNPFNPKRFFVFVVTGCTIMLSGFRSIIIYWGFIFIAACMTYKRKSDLVVGGFILIAGIMMITIMGNIGVIPATMQRSLSFLPGLSVDEAVAEDAEGSIEWRMEMWTIALSSDKYISNKFLGDGFGFSAVEYQLAMDESMGFGSGQYGGMEYLMARGSYHGFHVETIRFTGVVGLIIATIFLFYVSKLSYRIGLYFYGREEFKYVVLIVVPMMIYLYYYWLVFGAYKNQSGFSYIILQAGLVKMLENIMIEEKIAKANAIQ